MAALNLKSDEAHRLAREIARATGTSLTGAVLDALREKRARLDEPAHEARVQRMLSYGARLEELRQGRGGARGRGSDPASKRGEDGLFDDSLGLPG